MRRIALAGGAQGSGDMTASLTAWHSSSDLVSAFNIGMTEAKAAMAIYAKFDKGFTAVVTKAVKQFGFSNNGKSGFITHDALASDVLEMNFKLPGLSAYWAESCRSTPSVLELLGERLVKDFEETAKVA